MTLPDPSTRHFFRRALVALAVLACTAANARAQSSTTATLRGHVEDPSGAVLPGVTMTLTNTAGGTTSHVADPQGAGLSRRRDAVR